MSKNSAATQAAPAPAAKKSVKKSRAEEGSPATPTENDFEHFRTAFLMHFGENLHNNLSAVFGKHMQLHHLPMAPHVQKRFMDNVKSMRSVKVAPALHGTKNYYLDSIFQNGLIIKDRPDNGWVYGKGIYTANLDAPWLSQGFASHSEMLIVANLQTSQVDHNRDHQLVKDISHTIPLFQVRSNDWQNTGYGARGQLGKPSPVSAMQLLKSPPVLDVLDLRRGGTSPVLLRWLGIGYEASEMREIGFTAAELEKGGYSAVSLRGAGYPAEEVLCLDYAPEELKKAAYPASVLKEVGGLSASKLRGAGYSNEEVLALGFSLDKLKEANFSAAELAKVGWDIESLKGADYPQQEIVQLVFSEDPEIAQLGISIRTLRLAGYKATAFNNSPVTVCDLAEAGYGVSCLSQQPAGDLREVGFSLQELRTGGRRDAEIITCGFPTEVLRIEGQYTARALRKVDPAKFSAAVLLDGGYTISELEAAGFESEIEPTQLQKAGFKPADLMPVDTLKDSGYPVGTLKEMGYSACILKEAGFSLVDLLTVGFTCTELLKAGFTAKQLRRKNFTITELQQAGCCDTDIMKAGFSLEDMMHAGIARAGGA